MTCGWGWGGGGRGRSAALKEPPRSASLRTTCIMGRASERPSWGGHQGGHHGEGIRAAIMGRASERPGL
eukprot:358627-Chlamydomonas_euryale.AAC.2